MTAGMWPDLCWQVAYGEGFGLHAPLRLEINKKLSYRRETARQLPTWREGGVRPSSPLPSAPSGYTYAYGWIRKPQRTYVKRAVRKAH